MDDKDADQDDVTRKNIVECLRLMKELGTSLNELAEIQLNIARLAAVRSLLRRGYNLQDAAEMMRLCQVESAATGDAEARVIRRTLVHLKKESASQE